MEFAIVVAADRELGIGKDGGLPWRLPGDMAHFKQLTSATTGPGHNAVIMGRKTWESIPERFRPLGGRRNVVVSRNPALELPTGVTRAPGLDAALDQLAADTRPPERVFVIGGGAIYAEAMAHPGCRTIYFTRIAETFDCDTFFPAFERDFHIAAILGEATENGVAYRIEVWNTRHDAA